MDDLLGLSHITVQHLVRSLERILNVIHEVSHPLLLLSPHFCTFGASFGRGNATELPQSRCVLLLDCIVGGCLPNAVIYEFFDDAATLTKQVGKPVTLLAVG